MRYVRTLGLAAVAAAALIALAAVGTASATVICKNNLSTEKCSEPYPKGTAGKASLEPGTSMLMKGPFGETIATCTESTVTGTSANTGSATETVKSTLTSLTFSKCNHPVTVKAAGTGELHWIPGTDNGILTTTGTTVIVDETLFGACQYVTNATSMGTVTGGNPGTFDLNAKITSENGCPQGSLSGSYIATEPTTGGWVTSG